MEKNKEPKQPFETIDIHVTEDVLQTQENDTTRHIAIISPSKHDQSQSKLSDSPSQLSILLKLLVITTGSFNNGYPMAVLNMAMDKLNMAYDITENKVLYQGILVSSYPLSCAVGSILAGYLLKIAGRRRIFLGIDLLSVVFSLLYLISDFYAGLAARFLFGILQGIQSVIIPQCVFELSPQSMIGKTGVMHQAQFCTGILIAYLFGLGFPLNDKDLEDQSGAYWRIVLIFPAFVALFRFIMLQFFIKQDTPNYYEEIGQEQQARQVLQTMYPQDQVEPQLQQLKEFVESNQKIAKNETYCSIFKKETRKQVILGAIMHFIMQFSGINGVIFYSSEIFAQASDDDQMANIMTAISGLIILITVFCATKMGQKFSRRKLILAGYAVMMSFTIVLGAITHAKKSDLDDENLSIGWGVVIIVVLILYLITFNLSVGSFIWVYGAEIIQGKGLSVAVFSTWFFTFVIGLIFPILKDSLGIHSLFYMFGVIVFIGLFYLKSAMVETNGKTMEEIKYLFYKPSGSEDQKTTHSDEQKTPSKSDNKQQNEQNLPAVPQQQ